MTKKDTQLTDAFNILTSASKKKTSTTSENTDKATNESKPVIQEVKKKKRMGRPTNKKEGVKYVKISARIEEETRKMLRISMADKFDGKYKTQDELINEAIRFFIEKN